MRKGPGSAYERSVGNVITGLIPPLFGGMSQARTWISNGIRGGLFMFNDLR
jgi:hypothetical protein